MSPRRDGGRGDAREGFVEARVRGRYLAWRAAPGAPLLVGFHGYAESADHSFAALSALPGAERWHLASIQALHPFYNSRTREVVASWMTSLDRERAIVDNVAYVAAAVAQLRDELAAGRRLALLGFSQGTAMAYRAAALGGLGCDAVIALAGDVPKELAAVEWSARPRVLIGRGADDEWYSEGRLAADRELLAGRGLEVEVCRFAGGHEWSEPFRDAAGRLLAALDGAAS